jgi:HK97 family phage major capsid protein/HK97 family phage prohead protease
LENRAYSLLEIRAVDDERRIITGIASTPSTDRMDDIVDSMGAEYKLPIPFLWQHESKESPIGNVVAANPTKDGIPVRIEIASDDEPGPLQDRLNYAWRSIKKGLVRGLSIGFRSLESEPIENSWGVRFKRWEWLELSAVTVPANAEASIQTIKSIDADFRTATGNKETTATKSAPGASGRTVRIPKHKPTEATMYGARIKDLEGTRATKLGRIQAIEEEAAGAGRTKDAAQQEEFDELAQDVEAINKAIADLQKAQRLADAAKEVDPTPDTKSGSDSRSTTRVHVKTPPAPDKGIRFAQLAMCLAKAKGHPEVAHNLMQRHYPHHPAVMGLKAAHEQGEDYGRFIGKLAEMHTKAPVDGGTTAAGSWTHPLLAHNDFTGDFIEFLRAQTIIGQMGSGGVPGFRRIPFNVTIKGQSGGSTGGWTGQGQPKPVTKGLYFDAYHGFKKATAISVISDELIRFSDPSAEALVRDDIANAVTAVLDGSLVDTVGADANRPAGLLQGVAGVPASGVDHIAIKQDLKALWAAAIAANQPISSAVYWTTPAIAQSLSLMHGELSDAPLFPNIGLGGGSLLGVPVVVSNYVPAGNFILVFAQEVYLSDDNTVTVDASREATIEMETAPENAISDLDGDNPAPQTIGTGAAFVSMYQTNSVALRAERYVNWSKRRATAVNRLTGVEWGEEGES